MNTKEAKDVQRWAKNDKKSLDMASLFRGVEVRLGAAPDDTFLVIGKSPMSGADNTWFWLVRKSGEKATILLWAGVNCLYIGKESNAGLNDIQTTWASASETITDSYSFDGIRYKMTKTKRQPVTR